VKDGRVLFEWRILGGEEGPLYSRNKLIERPFRPITIKALGNLACPEALASTSKTIQTKTN